MSEEFEKLDSPLVVHKETDASYLETANIDIVSTAKKIEENKTSLVRHRFKRIKEKQIALFHFIDCCNCFRFMRSLFWRCYRK